MFEDIEGTLASFIKGKAIEEFLDSINWELYTENGDRINLTSIADIILYLPNYIEHKKYDMYSEPKIYILDSYIDREENRELLKYFLTVIYTMQRTKNVLSKMYKYKKIFNITDNNVLLDIYTKIISHKENIDFIKSIKVKKDVYMYSQKGILLKAMMREILPDYTLSEFDYLRYKLLRYYFDKYHGSVNNKKYQFIKSQMNYFRNGEK